MGRMSLFVNSFDPTNNRQNRRTGVRERIRVHGFRCIPGRPDSKLRPESPQTIWLRNVFTYVCFVHI